MKKTAITTRIKMPKHLYGHLSALLKRTILLIQQKISAQQFKKYQAEKPPVPDIMWQNPLYFIAFGFGSGAMPVAPGTFGTLMAIPFYWLLATLPLTGYLSFLAIFTVFTIWLCHHISRAIKVDDHPGMCIDEFVGYFITMINAPHGASWIILGFLLFRFFDILKPWPIDWIDRNIKGGIGMILDDALAGFFSLVILQILAKLAGY